MTIIEEAYQEAVDYLRYLEDELMKPKYDFWEIVDFCLMAPIIVMFWAFVASLVYSLFGGYCG